MAAEQVHARTVSLQDLRYQQAQFSVTQKCYAVTLGNFDLIQDFTRSGDWFDEDSLFRGNRIGHAVQVMDGQREEFSERPWVFYDAENGARRAVAAEAAGAPIAVSTGQIDFAGYPASDPLCAPIGDGHHFAHKFMPRRAGEAVVAALQFKIRGTDPGGEQTDASETLGYARQRLAAHFDAAGF